MQAVEIKIATQEQKPVLKWLLELYAEEFSQLNSESAAQKQVFIDSEYVDLFWKKPEWVPVLIFYHDKVAGFALIVSKGSGGDHNPIRVLPEFFVLKRYRHQNVGKQAAFHIFDAFPGRWEVTQSEFNAVGQEFWRKVIQEYTSGEFSETIVSTAEHQGPVQSFDNGASIRS